MHHAKIDRSLLQNQYYMSVLKWGDHLQNIRSFLQIRQLASKSSCAKGHHTVQPSYYKFPFVQAQTLQGLDYQQFVRGVKAFQAEKGLIADGVIGIETWYYLKMALGLEYFANPLKEMIIRDGRWKNTFGIGIRKDEQGNPKNHQGWDLHAVKGTPFYAISDGIVEKIDNNQTIGGYGKTLTVKFFHHEYGWNYIFYAHLDSISADIKKNAIITVNTKLGKTGITGYDINASTEHLHIEIWQQPDWIPGMEGRINPANFFGTDLLKDSVREGVEWAR